MSEPTLIPAITIAFVVTISFMFALRPFATSVGLLDRPGGRKSHLGDVPVIGGLAMFQGVFAGLLMALGPSVELASLFSASFLLIAIGVFDDKYTLSPFVRIVTQIAVVLIMVYGGKYLLADLGNPFGFGVIELGPLALIFTTVVTLTMINAYNLVDGIDGLAGCLALIALLALAAVGGYASPATAALTVSASAVAGEA